MTWPSTSQIPARTRHPDPDHTSSCTTRSEIDSLPPDVYLPSMIPFAPERRRVLRTLGAVSIGAIAPSWAKAFGGRALPSGSAANRTASSTLSPEPDSILAGRPLVRYPEKTDLILL